MKFQENAKCLSAESNKYFIDGKDVISHKIRFNVGGEIFACRSNAEQVVSFKDKVGKTGDAVFVLTSPKENLRFSVESFEV